MRMWAQSHLYQKPQRINSVLAGCLCVNPSTLGRQPVGQRVACLRQKVWPALFCLS